MMKKTHTNLVSSYLYYIWNAWGKEECRMVFGQNANHFLERWENLYRKYPSGAAKHFYAELSPTNRRLILERVCELYDVDNNHDSLLYIEKQPEESSRQVIVIGNAPQSLVNLLMAGNIPFAYSSGTFIVFDYSSSYLFKEYLERQGVPSELLEQMTISQQEISIHDIPLP